MERESLCFLVGPTAAGKSELALALAERTGAEILSLDSMLVYRGLDVGTAKPSASERARAPHHLLDLVLPDQRFTAQDYVAAARAALADVQARGRRAFFVGGTGLYLKLLTSGLFEGPEADPALRARLEARYDELGSSAFHGELLRLDPPTAARLHPNDKKRVVRALEVYEQTGRPLSAWQREWSVVSPRRWRIAGLDLAVAELDRRILARTEAMLAGGWADEARRVRASPGFGPTAAQALGYHEVLQLVDGELTAEECARRIALKTRQFARRQRTWFRKFPESVWFDPQTTNPVERLDGVRRWFEL
ncbi:MAG: tRNA (adenosine(37)-N6)-dimethylallyltransferase MiaA [Planctomycetes bacterium]|nr:tRNA (adenosine(37)-N6)-dimethylallyltransferase MiaA [Planctomycetota bacterium]